MDPLARRRLGLTAVEVTQLGFGGAGLGDLFEVIPEAQAAATLQAAWDAGIRYYDTAPWYGLTQSEHRFGRALYRQPRRDFVLSTKVGRTKHAVHHAETYDRGIWTGGLPFMVRFDYSYDGVMRSFEDSLQRLGLTAVEVTQLGFGGAGLGDLFEVIPEAQAAATLEAAWDAGIRYYDTAPWYGLTQSEHRFGRALYRQPRRDFVLSTKVGRTMHAVHHAETYDRGIWTGGLPFRVRFDYSYDGVMRSFEDSLQRLGLPRIDLLVIHDLDIQYHQTYKRIEALCRLLAGGDWIRTSSTRAR